MEPRYEQHTGALVAYGTLTLRCQQHPTYDGRRKPRKLSPSLTCGACMFLRAKGAARFLELPVNISIAHPED